MTVLAAERIERPALLFGPALAGPEPTAAGARRPGLDLGGGLTLDETIAGAWEGLAARVVVACPLCGGALRPQAHGEPDGGRCADCGTTLD